MGQPHFPRLGFFSQFGGLIEGHMLLFSGLGFFSLFSVHSLADKQVRICCIFRNHWNWTGIGTVSNFQTSSCWPKYHLRCVADTILFDGLAFLETAPQLHRNILALGPL